MTAELKVLAQWVPSPPADTAPPPPPPPPPADTAPPPPPAGNPAGSETWTWPTLMSATMAACADENHLADKALATFVAQELGLETFSLLSNRPDLFDVFVEKLGIVK